MEKALIAMSGGVDSSVAAFLMQQKGYVCIGATMNLLGEDTEINDALKIAEKLNMPFHTVDLSREFKKEIIGYFIESYEAGETPNPCLKCNKYFKFGKMQDIAKELGCSKVATGHYAIIEKSGNRYLLKKAADPLKDQSYFLYSLTQEQLAFSEFPLGEITKEEAREIAVLQGFINAKRKDSQDICFVPDGDYISVIENVTGKKYPEGDFIDEKGNVLGKHKGIIRYTVGQRKGLGLALPQPMYVKEKNVHENKVILCKNEELFEKELIARDFNWIAFDKPEENIRAKAKIRCRHKEADATLIPLDDGKVKVVFDEPQRAIAKGQAVVAYDGDIVIGGGIII